MTSQILFANINKNSFYVTIDVSACFTNILRQGSSQQNTVCTLVI